MTPRSRPHKGPRAPRRRSLMSTTHPPRHISIGVVVDGSRTANGQQQSRISRMANQPNGAGLQSEARKKKKITCPPAPPPLLGTTLTIQRCIGGLEHQGAVL